MVRSGHKTVAVSIATERFTAPALTHGEMFSSEGSNTITEAAHPSVSAFCEKQERDHV